MNSEITLPIEGVIPTLALMYYDCNTGLLKEINGDDIYIEMSAFESSIRRFYLAGELLNNLETAYKVAITLQSPQRYNYEVRVLAGEINPRLHQFEHASNVVLTSYSLASNRFANAIPVDILLTSKNDTEALVVLDIEIDSITISAQSESTIGTNYFGISVEWSENSQGSYSLLKDNNLVLDSVSTEDLISYFTSNGYNIKFFQKPA